MKRYPKYTAVTTNAHGMTVDLEFNEASHEDMSKDDIERYIKSAFPNLEFKGFR